MTEGWTSVDDDDDPCAYIPTLFDVADICKRKRHTHRKTCENTGRKTPYDIHAYIDAYKPTDRHDRDINAHPYMNIYIHTE